MRGRGGGGFVVAWGRTEVDPVDWFKRGLRTKQQPASAKKAVKPEIQRKVRPPFLL